MGKQHKHEERELRREARKEKNQTRFNSFQDLETTLENRKVKLSKESAKTVPVTKALVAVAAANSTEAMTKAGVREYNDFFGLYAKSVREKKPFRPLGFIPGPAILLEFREGGETQVLAATPDVAQGFEQVPTPWMKWEALPEKIRQALAAWKAYVDGLGYEPSPYNLGLARGLLEGKVPTKYLAMVMPRFRYRPDDPEKPLAVALLPVMVGGELQGLKVKIYNPKGIPDVPADGTILTLDELKNGRGPVQKLLRTWTLMENNYLGRYDRDGNRLQNGSHPHPHT